MYIEGNALILGDSSYLEHHGILGQRWGVRRFQNKDGTRTAAGKARDQKNAAKQVVLANRRTRNQWQYQNSLTKAQDKLTNDSRSAVREMAMDALNGKHKAEYETAVEEYDAATNYRYDEYRKEENKYLAIAGMASGNRYPMLDPDKFDQDTRLKWDAEFYMYDDGDQGKYNSYDYFLVAKGENPNKVFDRAMKARNNIESIADKDVDDILGDYKDHPINSKVLNTTIKTTAGNALKERIVDMATSASDYTMVWEHQISYTDDEIKSMKNDIKKYEKEAKRLGLIHSDLFIEDGTLYLSHHGIRGQRWGVRRFQNRDGSLTNAGRKRLGYATKGAAQAVGKAFKAGVKAGGNAVKAAKAHHEKKEAEKKEKKKEKASQSRLGVLANKDLFTDDELRALNQRFKVEDELKMASIQKGVEIAKAVGTIASNAATAAKAYEDITGQSLSPIKRQAAELKKQQDAEDRARKIAREDAEEARKVAQEERNVKTYEQELRKATASADKEEFLAKKTKAQADQEILKALKGARDFNNPDDDDDDPPKPPNGGGGNPPGGGSDDGSSWVQKATAGGKNPFEKMIYDNDPEYKAAKDAHDEKVARKERMEYLDKHIAEREQEKQAEKAAKDKALMDMINQSNARTGRGQSQPETPEPTKTPRQDSDALFSQKGSLPIDKDRYRNRKAAEKAKKVKEDVAEDRAKKQDEKAVNQTINDIIEAQRRNTERTRNMDPHAYDRAVAKEYVKEKAKETIDKIPETLGNLNPINRAAKKIANKVEQEGYENTRKAMKQQYEDMAKAQGSDEANYVMYNTRVAGLQGQGYSERQAKQIANSDSPFSSKRNRRSEHAQRVSELETARKNTVKKLDQAEKNAVDDYYKKIYLDAYAPGTDKREALDREYNSTMSKINKLREENQQLYDKGIKDAQKILEHSFSIQNGVLFVDESVALAHHGIKGDKMTHYVENGTLFINAGEPYLEHHGVLGMKWGKHLRAGKGPASAPASAGGGGGGAPEEDEETKKKIEEAAKKAGMTADEYRKKFADKVAEIKKAAYNAAGGNHKKNAEGWRKMAQEESNAARASEKSSHENSARAASQDRKYGSGGDVYRRAADSDKENAETHRSNAKARSERAASEQAAYEKSLAGKYDKMKADRARKKSIRQRQDKAFSGTSPKEKKRVARKDQYLALPEQKKRSRVYDDKAAETRRARAERLTRDSEIFNRTSEELKRKQNSALNKGNKQEAERKGKDAQFAQDWAEEGRRGAKDWRTGRRTGKPVLRTDSLDQVKKQHDKTISGKIDKARHTIQRGKQKLYNAAGGKYKEAWQKKKVQYRNDLARMERAKTKGDHWNASAAGSMFNLHSQEANRLYNKYDDSLAGRYDEFKAKRKKKKAKHFDNTNAIYTEGTRLVINSKWG